MSKHIERLFSEYIDNELADDERNMAEKHLLECQECKNKLIEFVSIREMLFETYQKIDIPDLIEDRVIAKLKTDSINQFSKMINRSAFFLLTAFGLLFITTTSLILTFGLHIFHAIYSISRGIIYAVPSIISSIPYVVEVVSAVILLFIVLAVASLRYLLKTMGKTIGAEDL